MKKLAVFDLDGTLFDTKDVNFSAYSKALEDLGYKEKIDYKYYCDYCNGTSYKNFIPMILGCPTYENRGLYKSGAAAASTSESGTPAIVGVAGDWTQAVWGTVEGIDISFSDQATLQNGTVTINLWQQNMFAVRAEIEVGFRALTDCFNILTGAIPQS